MTLVLSQPITRSHTLLLSMMIGSLPIHDTIGDGGSFLKHVTIGRDDSFTPFVTITAN